MAASRGLEPNDFSSASAVMSSAEAFLQARDFLLAHRLDHETAYREFTWPQLGEFNWALDHFDAMAGGNARPALWVVDDRGGECKLSFEELAARSNRVANGLRGLGVKRGERVLVMLGNEVALWETVLAAMKLGAVLVPATTLLPAAELRDRMQRAEVRHVVAAAAATEKFAELPGAYTRIAVGAAVPGWHDYAEVGAVPEAFVPDRPTAASDPLLIYFTSGTTAKPKLVLHTHQSYPVGHLSTMYWLGLQPGDIHFNISSPGWAKHAWSSFFAPWNAQACVFVLANSRFDARAVLQALGRYGISTFCAPPTVWRMLVQEDLERYPNAVRELASAGEPLNAEVIERVRRAWGVTIRDGFGQSETTAVLGNPPGQRLEPGALGRALPGYRVRLLDPEGQIAPAGEICIALEPRPTGLMAGYQDNPAKNAEAMRGGHYHTGDTASVDADGYVTYVGRADDVFKSSDYLISPFELESALIEHPGVAEAAVVPVADAIRLAVPKAFVTASAGHAPGAELARDIFGFLRRRLAPYKRVRRLEFAELPKTISGKIRRVELRQAEQGKPPGAPRGALEFFEEDFAALD
jgi:acetyl-CoA synthetase